jgi:hypothetical protein
MAALSVFTITNANATAGGHTVCTYTGTITSGASPLVSGTPIIVAGCTSANFNGNLVISGGNLTTTFTATIPAQNTNEAESGATGTVDPEGVVVYPTDIAGGVGYGYAQRLSYPILDPYGNFIPGTLAGTGQYIEV